MKSTRLLFLFFVFAFVFSCKNPTAEIKLKPVTNPSLSEEVTPGDGEAPLGEDINSGNLPLGYEIPDSTDPNGPIASDSGKNFNERTASKTFYGKEKTDEWKFIFSEVVEGSQKVQFIWNNKLYKTYTFEAPEKDSGRAGFNQNIGVYLGFKLADDGSYIYRTKTSFVSLTSIDWDNTEYAYKSYLVKTPPTDTLFQNAEKNKVYQRRDEAQTLHTYVFSPDGGTLTYEITENIDGEIQATIEKAIYTYSDEISKTNATYIHDGNEIKIRIDGTVMYFDEVEVGDTEFSDFEAVILTYLKEGGIYRIRPLDSDGKTTDTLYEYEAKDKGRTIVYKATKYPSSVTLITYKLKRTEGDYSALYYEDDNVSRMIKFTIGVDGTTLTPEGKPTGVKDADDPGYITPTTFAGTVQGRVYKYMGEDLILHEYIFSTDDGKTLTFKQDNVEINAHTWTSQSSATEAVYGATTFKLGRDGYDLLDSSGNVIASLDFVVGNVSFGKEVKGQKFLYGSSKYSKFEGGYGYKTLELVGFSFIYGPGTYEFVRFSKNNGEAIYKRNDIYYRFKVENNKLYRSMWGVTVTTPEAAEDYGWDVGDWGTKNGNSGDILRFAELVAAKTYRRRDGNTFYKYSFSADSITLTYESGPAPNDIKTRKVYKFKNDTTLTSSVYTFEGEEIELSLQDIQDNVANTLNQDGNYVGKLGYHDANLKFADLVVGGIFKNGGETWKIEGTDGYKKIVISGAGGSNGDYEFYSIDYKGNIRRYQYCSKDFFGVWYYYVFSAIADGESVRLERTPGGAVNNMGDWMDRKTYRQNP